MTVRVEDQKAGSDRVRLAFEFDSYHEMWNGATVAAPADLYRARAELSRPLATVALWRR